jgi:hypothetical protein
MLFKNKLWEAGTHFFELVTITGPAIPLSTASPGIWGLNVREVPMLQATADWVVWSGLPQTTGTDLASKHLKLGTSAICQSLFCTFC